MRRDGERRREGGGRREEEEGEEEGRRHTRCSCLFGSNCFPSFSVMFGDQLGVFGIVYLQKIKQIKYPFSSLYIYIFLYYLYYLCSMYYICYICYVILYYIILYLLYM